MRQSIFIGFLLIISLFSVGQSVPQNGVKKSTPEYYALKNVTIYVNPQTKINKGTILIHDDKVIKVGKVVSIPNGAVEIDLNGKYILPAFIELHSNVGLPEVKSQPRTSGQQLESTKEGAYYWNEAIHPEIEAQLQFVQDEKATKQLIEKGFGFALTHQMDGIARGTAAFVSFGKEKGKIMRGEHPNSFYSLKKGVSRQSYPSSQMGAIALLRQAFYDANWYADNAETRNLSLEALLDQQNGQLFFETDDKYEILRAKKIADEFNLNFVYIGSGNEYESLREIAATKSTIVVPLSFPSAYDVKNPYVARQIPLSELKHWEMAPMNPRMLIEQNVPICLSTRNTNESTEFWDHLRSAIQHGLTEEAALNALTVEPAKTVGFEQLIGSLEEGKYASFMVYDKNPLEEKAQLLESWLLGEQTIYKETPAHDIRGKYTLQVGEHRFPIEITGTEKLKGKVDYSTSTSSGSVETGSVDAHVELNNNDVTIQFNLDTESLSGSVALRGKVNTKFGVFEGSGLLPDGNWVKWSGIKKGNVTKENAQKNMPSVDTTRRVWSPNMAYGFDTLPERKPLVIKNATIWTNEIDGVLKNATLVVVDGKITQVGTGNYTLPPGAKIIDAQGKHVTSGIIDEHSHIAIYRGVNESGQAISAEVNIGDVVNPDDINIYRQLSGGVTTSHLLHGSANPIGGQSALIKLKWGGSAEDMLIDNAPKFIKFALGENVKQSNWGSGGVRFPQTRMGVEQVFYDGFTRAKKYTQEKADFKNGNLKQAPKVDLELEVLSEILQSNRFISCHSYVQSEINMLMHVADSMGFTVNTFTHILEGYKVADKMVEHGAGGSTFSDWWAYKFEVNDAIPYNAKLMADQGVVVAINSDDAEMGRRLNQEAAKAVKYGGMSEEDAWKMVTLNPAKLLHLDDRMGSLKRGKDADIVIWSHNPLSIEAVVEYTIIDGDILFDRSRDAYLRQKNQQEKARIISKMLADNEAGGKKRPFIRLKKGHFHCNTIGEEASTEENHH